MFDVDIRKLIDKAQEAKLQGSLRAALQYYSDAFNLAVSETSEYSDIKTGLVIDGVDVSKLSSEEFKNVALLLKKDMTVAMLSNEIGVILGELGDVERAKILLLQAISLTPDNEVYEEPKINLEQLD